MTNLIKAETHNPSLGDKYFIDTNVWLYLLFPQYAEKPQRHIKVYSELFKRILEKNCLILNNFQVFSEFINAWFQICYKQTKDPAYKDFKDYRSSKAFEAEVTSASVMVNKMLSFSEVYSGQLNKDELKDLIKKCTVADLNDIYHADFCRRNKLKLITHDFDFSAFENKNDLVLISANNNFFQ